jgi:uncharacterized membrane protein
VFALTLLVLAVTIGVVIYYFGRLSSETERLAKRLGDVERTLAAGAAGVMKAAPAAVEPTPEPVGEDVSIPITPDESEGTADTPIGRLPPPDEVVTGSPAPPPRAQPSGPYGGVEQALGTKWAVWLGGIALALGGLFLVRYSIEAGWLGPGVRILLGALLAAALAIAGEWSRRREVKLGVAIPSAYIPGVLTAVAIVVAFGTIYAAHALYGFLGPASAFLLLGATGLLSMLGALRHGPALAALGLAASYVTPMLVASHSANAWPVVLFLAVVAASAFVLARARRWLWLATVAVAGAWVWGAILTLAGGSDADWPAAVHIIAQLGLATIFMGIEPHLGTPDREARPDWIAVSALGALTILVVINLADTPFAAPGWLPLASLAMTILAITAWLSAPGAAAVVFAGFIALAVVLVWPGVDIAPDASRLLPGIRETFRLPETISTYLGYGAMTALGVAAVAGLRLWRGRTLGLDTAALYAGAATAPPLLALAFTYLRVTQFDASTPFAAAGIALAAAATVVTDRFQRVETGEGDGGDRLATGAFAASAIAALSFALFAVLERGYLTVAFALAALGAAYVASVRDIPPLRYAVAALGFVVLGRMIYDPRIMGEGVGTLPLINWLLVGYGIPALAFWQAARLLRPRGEDVAVRLADRLTVLFAALLAFFQIRHLLNAGDPFAGSFDHVELGLHVIAALALALVLTRLDLHRANPVFHGASFILGGIGFLFATFGLCVLGNPLLNGDLVTGRAFLSSLLLGYLLPGVAALYVARQVRAHRPAWMTIVVATFGLVLVTLYVSLSVRHAFQGPDISVWNATSQAEHWAHSAAWLGLGVLLLLYGLLRGAIEARVASALLVALAAVKIAVFDLSDVSGIWRALSFLCLGVVLIGIGVLYQRLIFGPRQRPVLPASPGA